MLPEFDVAAKLRAAMAAPPPCMSHMTAWPNRALSRARLSPRMLLSALALSQECRQLSMICNSGQLARADV